MVFIEMLRVCVLMMVWKFNLYVHKMNGKNT